MSDNEGTTHTAARGAVVRRAAAGRVGIHARTRRVSGSRTGTEPEPTPAPEPAAAPAPPTEWTPPPPPAAVAPATDIPLGGSGYPVNLSDRTGRGPEPALGHPVHRPDHPRDPRHPAGDRAVAFSPSSSGSSTLFSWIPILVNGRQAAFVYTITGGYLRLGTRVGGYVLLMTGRYPPFGPGGEHTIDLTFDETEEQNRLWGIPLIGLMVRWILLIPHFIVLFFIGIVLGFISLITWIPVLVNGRTADWVVRWVGGFYRWFNRVYAYGLLLTGKYPPFRLDD